MVHWVGPSLCGAVVTVTALPGMNFCGRSAYPCFCLCLRAQLLDAVEFEEQERQARIPDAARALRLLCGQLRAELAANLPERVFGGTKGGAGGGGGQGQPSDPAYPHVSACLRRRHLSALSQLLSTPPPRRVVVQYHPEPQARVCQQAIGERWLWWVQVYVGRMTAGVDCLIALSRPLSALLAVCACFCVCVYARAYAIPTCLRWQTGPR
jgi:hypothetical protein